MLYLDRIDSSIEPIAKGRAIALADMRAFVARIAERGRAKCPGLLVLPQNGEELLDDPAYVALIEGVDDPATIAKARQRLEGEGYIVHFADRDLARKRFGDVSHRQAPPAKTQRGAGHTGDQTRSDPRCRTTATTTRPLPQCSIA